MDEYEDAWLSTQNVSQFHFLNPRPEDILVADIAHALSMLCRFGGHGSRFYSVAEHSIVVSEILEREGFPVLDQFAGLLHDAEETYLPDIPAPVKHTMPEAKKIYKNLRRVIYSRFKIKQANWLAIEDVDRRLCITEAKLLKLWNPSWYNPGPEIAEPLLSFWLPETAEATFMFRFRWLLRNLASVIHRVYGRVDG